MDWLHFLPFAFHFQTIKSSKMKVRHFFQLLLLLTGIFGFAACNLGDDNPVVVTRDYSKGIFVVNEGPFGGGGSITWHNPETEETVQDIFGLENGGSLGQFVQSLTFHNGKGYICVNGIGLVVIVDQTTFKFIDTIGGLTLPRYFLPLDQNTAYVSQWGKDGLDGSIARVDLNTNTIVKLIPVGAGPEKMIFTDASTLMVANGGGLGIDSTVSVVDLVAETETARITVGGKNPGDLVKSALTGSNPYVLCAGSFLDATPKGFLDKMAPAGTGFDIPAYSTDLCANPSGNLLYFAGAGKIWTANQFTVTPLFNQSAYGLACHPVTGDLYCADAKDFASPGEVVIYNAGGLKTGSFQVGIAPGEIIIVE